MRHEKALAREPGQLQKSRLGVDTTRAARRRTKQTSKSSTAPVYHTRAVERKRQDANMKNNNEKESSLLRTAIAVRFKNTTCANDALGWANGKLRRVLDGRQALKAGDMRQLAAVLDVQTRDEFVQLFFGEDYLA